MSWWQPDNQKWRRREKKLYDRLLLSPECMRGVHAFVHSDMSPNSQIRPGPILLFLSSLFKNKCVLHFLPLVARFTIWTEMCFNYLGISFEHSGKPFFSSCLIVVLFPEIVIVLHQSLVEVWIDWICAILFWSLKERAFKLKKERKPCENISSEYLRGNLHKFESPKFVYYKLMISISRANYLSAFTQKKKETQFSANHPYYMHA